MVEHPEAGIENKLSDAHSEKAEPQVKKEEHKVGTLESVINETSNLFGNALKLGLAGSLPYAQATFLPEFGRDTAILSGAQIASDYTASLQRGKKYTAGNFLESAALGTAVTVPLETMFRSVNRIPLTSPMNYVSKAALWGGVCYPIYNAMYLPVAYLVRNRTFKGMGKYIKENYWPIMKKSWKYILPFSLLNVFFGPPAWQIPIAATLSFIYDRFTAQKGDVPDDQKRDKTTYLAAAPSVAGKLVKNTFKAFYEPLYAIGSAAKYYASNLYNSSKSATKSAAQSPAAAAARP